MSEQRYLAVLAVIRDGDTVTEVAARFGVSRKTLHVWIVHHGGAGTTFGALAHGVPQVILPQGADNYEHAAMCETAGTAVILRPEMVTAANLVAAVRRVVRTEDYAAASRRCAEEIAAMPDAVAVATALRSWVPAI